MAITKVPVELSSTTGIVDNSNATAITIDSSENVLTGKTSSGLNTAGVEFASSGRSRFTRDGNNVAEFNRKTSDGSIVTFNKDATAIGSIGVLNTNNLTITCNTVDHGGLQFATHSITPMEAGSDANGTIDLGSANSRFKDLHLSGTISSGAITSGAHLINASSSAFGGSSVQGFNTDFLVDTGQGYSRHNSYHTGGSNHQFLVNATSSTSNVIALELDKDKNATFGGNIIGNDIKAAGSGGLTLQTDEGTKRLVIIDSGNVGIGTNAPDTKLHIVDALGGGQLLVANSEADDAEKYGTFGTQHYDVDQEPVLAIAAQSSSSENNVLIGGALGEFNAATSVKFFTAANATTTTGSEVMRVTSTKNLKFTGQSSTFESPGFTYHTNNYLYLRGGSSGLILSDDSGINTVQIIDGSSGYINFETADGSSRMRINANGRVGIGTTAAPEAQLDVRKTLFVGEGLSYNASSESAIEMGATNDTSVDNNQAYKFKFNIGGTAAAGQNLEIATYKRGVGLGEIVRVMGTTGYVGIGTTSPSRQLTVQNSSDHAIIAAVSGTSNLAGMVMGDTSDDDTGAVLYNNNGNYLYFQTDTTERMRIASDGQLLINKTGSDVGASTNIVEADGNFRIQGGNRSIKFNNASHEIVGVAQIASNKMQYGSGRLTIDVGNSRVGIGTTSPSGKLHVEGGRAGIISTDSSWGQFRVANSSVAEVGITVANGCTSSEFLSDSDPSSSNKFIMGISPYGAGQDTWGIGHGNLGDSVMHIDGSGNFGFGPHSENPHGYFEILKQKSGTDAPSDYELLFTLNSKGYFGNGYKAGLIRFCAGDTASGQDNFYAGIGCKTLTGTNNSEEGSLDFHVKNTAQAETLAVQIVGKSGTGIAGSGQHAKAMLFRYQGIAIDRVWGGYPGISVLNSSDYSTSSSTQSEFRVHGTNSASTAYPGTSGADFSVDFRVDGAYQTGSDRRRKKNITTIANALSTVKQLTGKKFQIVNRAEEVQETTSKNGYKFGFIAQDVESIIPETIKYNADEDDGTENWNSAYSLDYGSLTALLVNAIKEQDTIIQDLKSRIETLEG